MEERLPEIIAIVILFIVCIYQSIVNKRQGASFEAFVELVAQYVADTTARTNEADRIINENFEEFGRRIEGLERNLPKKKSPRIVK